LFGFKPTFHTKDVGRSIGNKNRKIFGADIFSRIKARIKRVRERGLPRDRSECEPQRRDAEKDQAKEVVWGYMVK
jgi:hypothetical protein